MAKDLADPDAKATAGVERPRGRRPAAPPPADPLAPLFAPARGLSGVGPRLEQALARLLGRPEGSAPRCLDLLWHLPQAVIDRQLLADPAAPAAGERVTLSVLVERHQPARSFRRSARQPYRVRCQSALGSLELVFFHARDAYLRATLPEGGERVVSGRLGRYGAHWQIVHPELIATPAAFARDGPLEPVYPLTEGLSGRVLGRLAAQALDELPELPEWQDPAWLRGARLAGLRGTALRQLHRPVDGAALAPDGAGAPPPRLRRAARQPAGAGPGAARDQRPARARAGRRRPLWRGGAGGPAVSPDRRPAARRWPRSAPTWRGRCACCACCRATSAAARR